MTDEERAAAYAAGYKAGQEKARARAVERVQWYRTDLAFRAPEQWPTHGELLGQLKHDMEHLRIVDAGGS